jgi:hypothetical protein
MNTYPIQSRTGRTNWAILLAGAAMFGFLAYKVGIEAAQAKENPQFVVFLAYTSGLAALLCLAAPWLFYHITLYEDCVVLAQLGGLRRILLWRHELASYELEKRKHKYATREVLHLRTNYGRRYSIDSQMCSNFEEIKKELTKGLPKHSRRAKNIGGWPVFFHYLGIVVVTTIAVGGFWILGRRAFLFRINEKELVGFACTLAEQPSIECTQHRSSKRYHLSLAVRERPDLNFDIYQPAFRATYSTQFVRNCHAGDSIFMWVSPQDYHGKIMGEQPVGFWENLFNDKHVEIYELAAKDNLGYLTVVNYERAYRTANRVTFWIWLFAIAFLSGIYWWEESKKAAGRK